MSIIASVVYRPRLFTVSPTFDYFIAHACLLYQVHRSAGDSADAARQSSQRSQRGRLSCSAHASRIILRALLIIHRACIIVSFVKMYAMTTVSLTVHLVNKTINT